MAEHENNRAFKVISLDELFQYQSKAASPLSDEWTPLKLQCERISSGSLSKQRDVLVADRHTILVDLCKKRGPCGDVRCPSCGYQAQKYLLKALCPPAEVARKWYGAAFVYQSATLPQSDNYLRMGREALKDIRKSLKVSDLAFIGAYGVIWDEIRSRPLPAIEFVSTSLLASFLPPSSGPSSTLAKGADAMPIRLLSGYTSVNFQAQKCFTIENKLAIRRIFRIYSVNPRKSRAVTAGIFEVGNAIVPIGESPVRARSSHQRDCLDYWS